MKPLKYLAVAVLVTAPLMVESTHAAHAAGGRLISAGSVTLSGLGAAAGVSDFRNLATPPSEGEEGEGHQGPEPGQAPRVKGNDVGSAGPELALTFAGLNHFDHNTANGGNQFSNEPPDQALCVGPNHVLEGVNTVFRVYDKAGKPKSDVISYNEFFRYPPAINFDTGEFGAFLTDPVCHFDPGSGRFFMAVLTIDLDKDTGDFTGANRLDIAVSETSDPMGDWNLYKLAVQNDGTEGTPNHHCDPAADPAAELTNPAACIGDFPHIGTDKYGVYISTNEYSFFGDGSNGGFAYTGSQIYAFSKSQLVAGAATPRMVSFENPFLGPFRSFTVWPAISPAGQEELSNGGTEFFLSSTLGDGSETGNFAPTENRIGVWAITNTSSIDSPNPTLQLSNKLIHASKYTLPPEATQKDGPTPLRDCLNDTSDLLGVDPNTGDNLGCWAIFLAPPAPAHSDLAMLDSSDTRMNQVVYTNGRLFSALGTGVRVGHSTRAGVLWLNVEPRLTDGVLKDAHTRDSGYVAIADNDVTYPAVGVSPSGKVVMAATVTGDDHYPSASYTVISDKKPTVHLVSEGVGPQDGFTGYPALAGGDGTARWGDYGAVAMDGDTLWLASESIEQSCTLDEYLGTGGTCGGTRTALANWGTRVSAINI